MSKLEVTRIRQDADTVVKFEATSDDDNIINDLEREDFQLEDIDTFLGKLKNCSITSYEVSFTNDDTLKKCYISGIATDIDYLIAVDFIDGKQKVYRSEYDLVKDVHGMPESMTKEKFKWYLMAENI